MSLTFSAQGHKNMLMKHTSTFEITKDPEVTERGDCIVACLANFDVEQIQKFLIGNKKFHVHFDCQGVTEDILCNSNPHFQHPSTMVFRIGDHATERTAAVHSSKSAGMLSDQFRRAMQLGKKVAITFISA